MRLLCTLNNPRRKGVGRGAVGIKDYKKKRKMCYVSLISILLHVCFFPVLVACIYPLIMSVMEKK